MKFPKEYLFLAIIGLFLLAYVLEAVVDPLALKLSSPYAFLFQNYFTKYPFTSAVVGIRAIAILLVPLLLFGFFQKGFFGKALFALIISGLFQLYSLQEIATGTTLAPLEWSLSLSLAGIALLVPTIFYLFRGIFQSMKNKIDNLGDNYYDDSSDNNDDDDSDDNDDN